jgi:hypothetical protein
MKRYRMHTDRSITLALDQIQRSQEEPAYNEQHL